MSWHLGILGYLIILHCLCVFLTRSHCLSLSLSLSYLKQTPNQRKRAAKYVTLESSIISLYNNETMDITECDHNSELLVTDGCFPKFPWKSSSSTEKKPQPIPDRTSLYYPMASSPRGRCLILNYDNFNILQNNAPRKGSTVDVHELKNTFSELRFDVVVHHNLSMKGTKDLLERGKRLGGFF